MVVSKRIYMQMIWSATFPRPTSRCLIEAKLMDLEVYNQIIEMSGKKYLDGRDLIF